MRSEFVLGKWRWLWGLGAIVVLLLAGGAQAEVLIDHTCTNIHDIPSTWVEQAKNNLHVVYQHTSHGSQLISGMNALENHPDLGTTYQWDDGGDPDRGLDLDDYGIPGCADLSQGDSIDGNGVTPWVTATRALLDDADNSHVNVVMWSWCSINNHNAQRYVNNMEILISEYSSGGSKPRAATNPVTFVFMTGHAEGQGETMSYDQGTGNGNVHYNNELIREHCRTHDRVLFDFADIEAHDPDGTYFWDLDMRDNLDYDGGNWAVEWLAANSGSELDELTSGCTECAHSYDPRAAALNCALKGRAAWWLMARIAGWDGGVSPSNNQAPVLSAIGNKSIVEGNALSFTLTATDPDGDSLEYTVTNLPGGASLNAGSGAFTWTPDAGDVGAHDLRFRVTDNGTPAMSDSETITITVYESGNGGNHPPDISPVEDQTVDAGETVTITFQASDPDGDALTCTLADMPDGASYDDATMTFTWTPQAADNGTHDIVFTATDDGDPSQTATHTVTITVGDSGDNSGGDSDSGGSGCFIMNLLR